MDDLGKIEMNVKKMSVTRIEMSRNALNLGVIPQMYVSTLAKTLRFPITHSHISNTKAVIETKIKTTNQNTTTQSQEIVAEAMTAIMTVLDLTVTETETANAMKERTFLPKVLHVEKTLRNV